MVDADPDRLRLYSDLAWLWPVMSPPEGYALEACLWRRVLREHLGEGRARVLELGVGGGHNTRHLRDEFEVTGVDLSEPMLGNARRLNPGMRLVQADMRTVRLGERFAAVLVHDAVAYMRSEDDLRCLFRTAVAHLADGGLLVMTPDHVTETFVDPQTKVATRRSDDLELTFFEYVCDPDPADTTYQTTYVWFLRRAGGQPEVHTDTHVHGLFPLATWLRLMGEAGFRSQARETPLDHAPGKAYMLVGTLGG